MTRLRSPNYPSLSLPAALERIRKVHAVEGQNEVGRESFVRILGYSGLSGPASKLLSSLSKYELVTKAGSGEIRISDRSIDVMFGDPDVKVKAIQDAANSPSLFAEINEKWPERPPSDENLSNFLGRNGFSMKVLSKVIAAYRDTMSLVSDESEVYDSLALTEGSSQIEAQRQIPQHQPSVMRPMGKMRVALTDDHLEVTASLLDSQSVDRLIDVLNANKVLLPAKSSVTETDNGKERKDE